MKIINAADINPFGGLNFVLNAFNALHSDSKIVQAKTLTRMFSLLKAHHIKINAFRAYGASYRLDVVAPLSKNGNRFYLRSCMSDVLVKAIADIDHWEKVDLAIVPERL